MGGNVLEWVQDLFDAYKYSDIPANNPTGPAGAGKHVMRGGSWYNEADGVRTVARYPGTTTAIRDMIGFRCVILNP